MIDEDRLGFSDKPNLTTSNRPLTARPLPTTRPLTTRSLNLVPQWQLGIGKALPSIDWRLRDLIGDNDSG